MTAPALARWRRHALAWRQSWLATVVAWLLVVLWGLWIVLTARAGAADAALLLPLLVHVAGVTAVGWLVAVSPAGRVIGWLFLAYAMVFTVQAVADAWATVALVEQPGSLPGGGTAAWVADLTWWVPLSMVSLLMLLFPTGRPPSAGWRVVGWMYVAGLILALLPAAVGTWSHRGSSFTGRGVVEHAGVVVPLMAIGGGLLVGSVVGSAASLVARVRRARAVERVQLTWFGLGAAAMTVAVAGVFVLPRPVAGVTLGVLGTCLPVSVGIAVLRYQLYDVRVVVNRSLLYGTLTVCLALVFVGVTTVGGLLVGQRGSAALSVGATAGVAILLLPMHRRLQRWANRVTYGDRHDPYAVMARVGKTLAAVRDPDSTLAEAARTVATALRLGYVRIDIHGEQMPVQVGVLAGKPEVWPLEFRGEEVGRLSAGARTAGDPLTDLDRRLLADLGRQLAPVLHAARLMAGLRRSRRALVAGREEERRRLRRDLHDGVGPGLAAASAAVEAALTPGLDAQARDALLDGALTSTLDALGEVRALSRGLGPPALDALGLVGAIRELAASMQGIGPAIDVTADDLGEMPAAVEVAAYRITSEALTNAARHAGASRCQVRLRGSAEGLLVDVQDDGAGVGPAAHSGVGMRSMRERVAELDGSLAVTAAPGGGTLVHAVLPWAGSR